MRRWEKCLKDGLCRRDLSGTDCADIKQGHVHNWHTFMTFILLGWFSQVQEITNHPCPLSSLLWSSTSEDHFSPLHTHIFVVLTLPQIPFTFRNQHFFMQVSSFTSHHHTSASLSLSTVVFAKLTLGYYDSKPCFYTWNFYFTFTIDSSMRTRFISIEKLPRATSFIFLLWPGGLW